MKKIGEIIIKENGPMDGIGVIYSPDRDSDQHDDWHSVVAWVVLFLVFGSVSGAVIWLLV